MILKILLTLFFLSCIIYSVLRPFASIYSKLLIIVGSILGIISVADLSQVNYAASLVGIQSGKDLYIYLSLITIFLFVVYTWERFKSIDKKLAQIVKHLALKNNKD